MPGRRFIALSTSLALHAIPLAWGLLTFSTGFQMPDIEIEFAEVEMIDPDLLQGAEPPEEPVVMPAPAKVAEDAKADPEEEGPGAEEKEKEKEKPKPKLGERRAQVDRLGPTNSTFYALLVNKRIRKVPFAEKGVEIMAPLPDFEFLIAGGGFHPLYDFDYMVIASPDVRDVTQTFLAVQSRLPRGELEAGVERAVAAIDHVIEWEERGGLRMGNPRPADLDRPDVDPRWVVFLDDHTAVYVREEFLPNIVSGPEGDARKTAGNFVANLTRMRRFARKEPRAGMQVVLKDLHAALRRVRGLPFPVPDHLEATVEASADPEVAVRLTFLSATDARAFARWFEEDLARIIDDDWKLRATAGWVYRLAELSRAGKSVTLRGAFTRKQAEVILDVFVSMSRKMLRKTPEEMEAERRAREAAWLRRKEGKLPPSAADTSDEGGADMSDEVPADGAAPPADGAGAGSSKPPTATKPPAAPGAKGPTPKDARAPAAAGPSPNVGMDPAG